MSYTSVLDALGDETRRRILEGLRAGPRAVGEIAGPLPVSRPAVSRHLRILEAAGLVRHRAEGTRRIYAVDARGLGEAQAWLEGLWGSALESFAAHVDREEDA